MAQRTVVVTMAGGAITDSLDVSLTANHPLVAAYPCLPWRPIAAAGGAPARVLLAQCFAFRAFFAHMHIGPAPADEAAAQNHSVLTAAFSAAAWSRWLSELVDSSLLNHGPFQKIRDSDAAMETLVITNPANLQINARRRLCQHGIIRHSGHCGIRRPRRHKPPASPASHALRAANARPSQHGVS